MTAYASFIRISRIIPFLHVLPLRRLLSFAEEEGKIMAEKSTYIGALFKTFRFVF